MWKWRGIKDATETQQRKMAEGEQWKQWQTLFSWAPKSLQTVTAAMTLRDTCSLEGVMKNLVSVSKSRDITLQTKAHLIKAVVFPGVMYRCESWTIKKLSAEKLMSLNCGAEGDSWESPGLQGDQTSQSERKLTLNSHWRTYAEPETPILWPDDAKSWLSEKGPDAGKDWR